MALEESGGGWWGKSAGGVGGAGRGSHPCSYGALHGGGHKLAHSEGRGDLRLEIMSPRTGPPGDQRALVSPGDEDRAVTKGQGSGQDAVCVNQLWT